MHKYELANWYLDLIKVNSTLELEKHIGRIPLEIDDEYIYQKIINHKFFRSNLWLYIPEKYISFDFLRSLNQFDDEMFKSKFEFFTIPRILLDEEILFKLIRNNYNYISIIPTVYKTRRLCTEAVTISGCMLKYIPNHLQDKNLIQLACRNIENLRFAGPNILTNDDVLNIICSNTLEGKLNHKIRLDLIPHYYHSVQIVKLLIEHDIMNVALTTTANKSPTEYVTWMAIDYFFDKLEQKNVVVKNLSTNTLEPLHIHITNTLKDTYPELNSAIQIGIRGSILANAAKDFLLNKRIYIKPHALPIF